MIAEGGPTKVVARASHDRGIEILLASLSLEKPLCVRMSEIPKGGAVIDGGIAQANMVGEGGNPHGQL